MPVYRLDQEMPILPPAGRCWVAPDAHVIGRVKLGEDVSVWFGAVLRGDNEPIEVGACTNIQEHCLLHTDRGYRLTVGPDCTIGHRAILHGCTIGANCLIGMGAILLNDVKLGDNCLVGAGALVTEGKKFPDNCLIVGSPAKFVRMLDLGEIRKIRQSALHYAENGQRFAQGLQVVSS